MPLLGRFFPIIPLAKMIIRTYHKFVECSSLESIISSFGQFLTPFQFLIMYHLRIQQGKKILYRGIRISTLYIIIMLLTIKRIQRKEDALSRRSYMAPCILDPSCDRLQFVAISISHKSKCY